jgi:hypothetical protein
MAGCSGDNCMGFGEKLLHIHLRANTWMSVIDQATVLLAHQPLVGNAGPGNI